jgi:cytochrome oxidase Cu insertion factor (SCO1/SenC/PrrC family)
VTRARKILVTVVILLVAGGGLVAWMMVLPKPQSQFADGEAAPDFTLNDQDGHPFNLASLRGSRVVLVFYRGYW